MKMKNSGIWFLVAGLLLLLLMAGSTSRNVRVDSSFLNDGWHDWFTVSIEHYKTPIVVGDTHFQVTANFDNPTNKDGKMWVQCSLLDYNLHKDWISGYARQATAITVNASGRNNCVENEPFTQTAQLSLDAHDDKDVTFTLEVPQGLDTKKAIIWCGTFEKCWDSKDTGLNAIGASDNTYVEVTVQRAGVTNTTAVTNGVVTTAGVKDYQCKLNRDCPGYFLKSTKCDAGYCVDIPPEEVSLDNSTVKQYIASHSIIFWIVGVALVLIGVYFLYEKPGQKFEF